MPVTRDPRAKDPAPKETRCQFTIWADVQEKDFLTCAKQGVWLAGDELRFCEDHFPSGLDGPMLKKLNLRAIR